MSSQLVFDHYPMPPKGVPNGWTITSIGPVAKLVASGFPSGEHNQQQRGVPHIRPMNINRDGYLDLSTLKHVEGNVPRELSKGDVLFNNTNSPDLIGKTTAVLIDAKLGYSNHMTRIQLEAGMNPVFVARQLHFLWMTGYFRHRCVNHVNQASISADPLSETVPLLVPPTAEQNRIADALDELLSDLDAGVAAMEHVRAKLSHYRASVLKAAVEGTLTSEWRQHHPQTEPASELLKRILAERRCHWEEKQVRKFKEKGVEPPKNWRASYKEPVAPDRANPQPLPDGWEIASTDAITLRITSGSRDWRKYYDTGSGVFIMAQNVRPGRLDLSTRQIVDPPKYDPSCERSQVQEGDILVTIVGANTGDACRVSQELAQHFVCQSVALMRPIDRRLAKYLDYYTNSESGSQLHYRRYIYGAGRPHLGFDQLKMTPVLVPPLAEQEAIVETVEDQLSVIEHLEDDLDAQIQSAQALRHSVLRHAFTGQLVPQDSNDEPASELLKRIASERETRARDTCAAKRAPVHAGAPGLAARRPRKKRTKES